MRFIQPHVTKKAKGRNTEPIYPDIDFYCYVALLKSVCDLLFFLQGVAGGDLLSIPNCVLNSAAMCDVDIRPVCL